VRGDVRCVVPAAAGLASLAPAVATMRERTVGV